MMKKATPEEAVAVTSVVWDISMFPVPPGFDARRVGLCIKKRLLERYGYCRSPTINAVGLLTDVHDDILRALSSSGINLYYTPFGILSAMSLMDDSPPGNILAICNRWSLPGPGTSRGYNIFRPSYYPHDSSPQEDVISWINLILEESGALKEEDACSETVESGSCFCLLCDDHFLGQGFESWTKHLSSPAHLKEHEELDLPLEDHVLMPGEDENPPALVRKQPERATPEEAVTSVFWDIKKFPVPPGFDARLVSPLIKRFLEKYGHSGPLTINAVGILTDLHDDILGELSSTGINLHHVLHGSTDIMSLMSRWISENPPPANILGICDPRGFSLPLSGYNLFRPFSYSSPQQDAILWESFLLAESGALKEEDTCSETGESGSCFCLICDDHLLGQGFESWTKHLSSAKHSETLRMKTEKEEERLRREKEIALEEEYPFSLLKRATPEEAIAVTSVFWDFKKFPVPSGVDARRVSPFIKRFLEKYGYSGPLTINAVGILADLHDDIRIGLSSTGIKLCNAFDGSTDIMSLMSRWMSKNPPPANIVGIYEPRGFPRSLSANYLMECDPRGFPLTVKGYNLFWPFSYSTPQRDPCHWESSLLADSGTLEEVTCSKTGEHKFKQKQNSIRSKTSKGK